MSKSASCPERSGPELITPPSIHERRRNLQTLKETLARHEKALIRALEEDLGKSRFESYATEIGFLYGEINYALKHLRRWMRVKRIPTPLVMWPSRSRVLPVPVGRVFIIAPWNYPVQLQIAPLVAALAAGNSAVLKPSELTPSVADAIAALIGDAFPDETVTTVLGDGRELVPALIKEEHFDHIFFTGSVEVGRIIGVMAAERHIPVTLELGGKSPAVVHKDAEISSAAKRIAFGKILNAGQTCVAPDYLLVHREVEQSLIDEIARVWGEFFPSGALQSSDYGSMVNQKRYETVAAMLADGEILAGGRTDGQSLKIEPTMIRVTRPDSPLLAQEIFGPILPVIPYETLDEAAEELARRPKPLAFYLFTRSREVKECLLSRVPFGGGCVNDTVMHLVNPALPFGGLGPSGNGSYHGKAGFDAMSHYKSIVTTPTWFNLPLKFPPYREGAYKLLHRIFS